MFPLLALQMKGPDVRDQMAASDIEWLSTDK